MSSTPEHFTLPASDTHEVSVLRHVDLLGDRPTLDAPVTAHIVDRYTGVITRLDQETVTNIANLTKTSDLAEQLQQRVTAVWLRFPGGMEAAERLGFDHPGVRPYAEEAGRIQAMATAFQNSSQQFATNASTSAEQAFGGNVTLPNLRGGSRELT